MSRSFMGSLSFRFPYYNPFLFSSLPYVPHVLTKLSLFVWWFIIQVICRVLLQTPLQKHLAFCLCYLNYCSKNLKFTNATVDDVVSTFIKLPRVSCLIVIVVYSPHHTHIDSQDLNCVVGNTLQLQPCTLLYFQTH